MEEDTEFRIELTWENLIVMMDILKESDTPFMGTGLVGVMSSRLYDVVHKKSSTFTKLCYYVNKEVDRVFQTENCFVLCSE